MASRTRTPSGTPTARRRQTGKRHQVEKDSDVSGDENDANFANRSLSDSDCTNILDVTGEQSPQRMSRRDQKNTSLESRSPSGGRSKGGAGRQSSRSRERSGKSGNIYPDLSPLQARYMGDSSFDSQFRSPSPRAPLHSPSNRSHYSTPPAYQASPLHRRQHRSSGSQPVSSNVCQEYLPHICLGCVAVVMIVVALFLPGMQRGTDPVMSAYDHEADYKQFLAESPALKDTFPRQTPRFWSTVFAPIKRVLKEEHPKYPAVILLASNGDNHSTAQCVARHVAQVVARSTGQRSYNTIVVPTDMLSMTPGDAKEYLDTSLDKTYGSGHRIIVIENLELMQPQAASMLHAYCDNENAPYKDVTILATVQMEAGQVLNSDRVEEYLGEQWGDVQGVDNLSALLSRLANNVAIIEIEDSKEVCA